MREVVKKIRIFGVAIRKKKQRALVTSFQELTRTEVRIICLGLKSNQSGYGRIEIGHQRRLEVGSQHDRGFHH